jgi:DnaJ-class molecular chaperone
LEKHGILINGGNSGNPETRAAYDQLGQPGPSSPGGFQPPPGWDSGFEFSGGGPEGQHIRLPGKGMPSRGSGPSGDLFLEVACAPHPIYRADGKDLYTDLPVTPWEAALGGKVEMATPDGRVELHIPKNARSGQ